MSLVAINVEPALYCGTYAKYNDGSIAGKWLNLTDYPDAEAFLQACRDLHRDEADPELMFQDFEGFPKDMYGESLSLTDLQQIYEWVHLDDDERDLLAEYMDATGSRLGDVDIEDIRDRLFCVLDRSGWSSTETAMGEYILDNGLLGEIPEAIGSYLDVEAIGRDWLIDLYVSSNGYVFEV
jgi:antirestriction protein